MARKTELVAIHGGGDWYDASAEYYIVPMNVDLDMLKVAWRKWYNGEYVRLYNTPERPKYQSFEDWLIKSGAVKAGDNDIEIYEDL